MKAIRLKRFMQYIHTLRYLRFRQLVFRLYYICCNTQIKPVSIEKIRHWDGDVQWPAAFMSCLTDQGECVFLGEKGKLDNTLSWNDQKYSKLWLYNLHYLNALNSTDVDCRHDILEYLITLWTNNNPPLKGAGWEPYPLSLRIVNLVKWYSTHQQSMNPNRLISLGTQAAVLRKRIEYHILGNHLFANGKALVFVGAYLDGPLATSWLKKGLNILDQEIKEQFLKDGAHFELSPMYHASLLWDMCDLVNLANQSQLALLKERKSQWIEVIRRAFSWLKAMSHPDGDISFFNDSVFGVSPTCSVIKKYIEQLGLFESKESNHEFSLQWLKESGYCVVHLGRANKAILDIAQIGPNYQPGHAHADTLSFELSLHGQRFLVNSGISHYAEDSLRQYQRSTRAHNTVCINAMDSSEVWAGFRVARRARPERVLVCDESNKIFIGCSHTGYLRLRGGAIHRREWEFTKNSLSIYDVITGKFEEAEIRYYFHPDVEMVNTQKNSVECYLPTRQQIMITVSGAKDLLIESTHWYPTFGSVMENYCLVAKFESENLLTKVNW